MAFGTLSRGRSRHSHKANIFAKGSELVSGQRSSSGIQCKFHTAAVVLQNI
jgi:hypothetical protein